MARIRLSRRVYRVERPTEYKEISLKVMTASSALVLALLGFKCQAENKNPFQTHPRIVNIAGSSYVVCWVLYCVKVKFPRLCPVIIPLGELFSSLSFASIASLLFEDSFRPLVFFSCLALPAGTILYSIFKKLGETQLWRRMPFHSGEQTTILPMCF